MELRNCLAFLYSARFESMSRAAEYLHVSQPAVSSQIHALEDELGVSLFTRSGKSIMLSPAGEYLLPYMEDVIDTLASFRDAANRCGHGDRPVVRIAAYDTYCTNDLQPIVQEFIRIHPKATPRVYSKDSNAVFEGIVKKDFDVGVISGQMQDVDGICQTVIRNDSIIIVASAQCVKQYTKTQLMCDLPVIHYLADNGYAVHLDTCLRQSAIQSERSIFFSGLDSVKKAVLHNIGIAALSEDLIRRELREGKLVPLDVGAPMSRIKTTIVFRAEQKNDSLISSFVELTKNAMSY
ncbi:LysR family transcriptional regulator [Bifidobacterium subtile]|uniref:Transcriptional regulator, LysR family protein n=1 Tax=Bifidobacterium subtile TaxID=77635 RepID=A0A087EAJ9_9BIFI|nr:LysR family transcriptional regulator [Bifidobacterium subtile]KFJ04800.1 transcriptional regulator, LysR family protein [Bifidobacterium subtile]QOL35871.1 LysR family transcriptional regulator [Bifidobacterium subtile]